MGLRAQILADTAAILSNEDGGFASRIEITSPDGAGLVVSGITQHIAQQLDPDTGMMIAGSTSTVTLNLAVLDAFAGLEFPLGVKDEAEKPWVVCFEDPVLCVPRTFKVSESMPDRTLGIVVLQLQTYEI